MFEINYKDYILVILVVLFSEAAFHRQSVEKLFEKNWQKFTGKYLRMTHYFLLQLRA